MFEEYLRYVDEKAEDITALSDAIFDYAEVAYTEIKSSEALANALEKEGFTVRCGVAGIPTAFTASYGSGKPAVGILAEYDALDDLSQEANVAAPKKRPDTNIGHGCGHNLFAGGSFGAAIAVKEYVRKTGKGSVTLFGCPAEEGGAGKVFLARAGIFDRVDAVVSWHPEKIYMVRTRPSLALINANFYFKGKSAHAGSSAFLGRSALDAMELMNVGVNYLREHMEPTSRIHYAILDGGGKAANVVQSHAAVSYIVRAVDIAAANALFLRVKKCAEGAATMTETDWSFEVLSGYSNLITNSVLQETAYEAMQALSIPVPTPEENAFGEALRATMDLTAEQKNATVYSEKLLPPAPPKPHGGSTDTADVSWHVPTVQMHIGTWAVGTPGHSWQAVAQGKSSYAKKAMLYAAKAVVGTCLRLISEPERIERARAEFLEKTAGGYVCPIPEGVQPPIPGSVSPIFFPPVFRNPLRRSQ